MENKNSIKYSETQTGIALTVPKPSLRYIDEFIKLKCSADLLIWKLFPNAKEITESMSVYNAYRRHFMIQMDLQDEKNMCICVGDGCTPRTGAIFATRSKWAVCSVDPRLRLQNNYILELHHKIKRLWLYKEKIEKTSWCLDKINNILVVAVHSHASLKLTVETLKAEIHGLSTNKKLNIISLPCCVPDDLGIKPDRSYVDMGIHSEKRVINIYREV